MQRDFKITDRNDKAENLALTLSTIQYSGGSGFRKREGGLWGIWGQARVVQGSTVKG